uniref:Secreted protein n=1 Tax=Arundo donax TaxID=35708 RepID=A0A0A9G8Q9_ARUDO
MAHLSRLTGPRAACVMWCVLLWSSRSTRSRVTPLATKFPAGSAAGFRCRVLSRAIVGRQFPIQAGP